MRKKQKPDSSAGNKQEIELRRKLRPVPEFDDSLPINQHRQQIQKLIETNQVVIVCGETGSGKTTQIPKICLEAGRGIEGRIAHTQPRRLAARSVAARIASELKSEIGQIVGFKIRFTDRVSPGSFIKLMTDGILLAETQHDRFLNEYDTIIIDEAHERSLNIDFLLGYLKTLLPRRPDLKVIITSATIDPQGFSDFFDNAPVIEVSGRSYPVETRYRSLLSEDEDERDRDMLQGILHAVDELDAEDPGDILVFVSGEREIREASDALRKHLLPDRQILPLYSRLSVKEQDRIFSSGSNRRVIISTNVAETSLTVPGIRHVVDTGMARISRYRYRSKVQHLPVEPISQASANQRKGRCGRNAPGICIRLYSEEDFNQRPLFTDPEILRTNLASVILSLSNLKLGRLENFPFINAPDSRVVKDGYRLLQELDALNEKMGITRIGGEMARLPVDPRLGRMLIAARQLDCLNEVLVICAALSIQDPRERPHDKREQAAQKQREFNAGDSDFITLLNIWQAFRKQGKICSQRQLRRWCRQHFISWMRMREWSDIMRQLTRQLRYRESTQASTADNDTIHRALLSGLLSHIGQHDEGREYKGPRQRQFVIAPDSVLAKKPPRWIMSASLVETHRLFARVNARVEPEWIEQAAGHRCQKHYSDPRWVKSQGRVMANEQVSLFGLIVVARRPVHYGPIDPQTSREIFIREALVENQINSRAKVLLENRQLIEELERLEHKRRRRDVIDEEIIYQFYERQIPDNIYQSRSFERWLKKAQSDSPGTLRLQRDDLVMTQASLPVEQFPDHLPVRGIDYHLSYHFEPGHALDGITVHVPVQQLNSLRSSDFEWLVPGLIREKLAFLLKSLPKTVRRNIVPIPDTVSGFLHWLDTQPQTVAALTSRLARYLKESRSVSVRQQDWQPDSMPAHLVMKFRILDEHGHSLETGTDLENLQSEFGDMASAAFAAAPEWDMARTHVTRWDFGELPAVITQAFHGSELSGYPCLCVDDQGDISIEVLEDPHSAVQLHHAGLHALILKHLPEQARFLRRQLPSIDSQCLYFSGTGSCQELRDDIIATCLDHCFLNGIDLPRDQAAFEHMLEQGRGSLNETALRLCELNTTALKLFHQCSVTIEDSGHRLEDYIYDDIHTQLQYLVYPGYLQHTGVDHLRHLPRYLKGILSRLDKYANNPARDKRAAQQLAAYMDRYLKAAEQWEDLSDNQQQKLESIHHLLEEFRISLFAQELGTAVPVSGKRLQKLFDEYRESQVKGER
jgi:ATP-dependent helicase HrpA